MDAKQEFEAHLGIILAVICKTAKTPERRQNALCWAWYYWPRAIEASDSLSQAAVNAAVAGAKQRRTFGAPSKQGKHSPPATVELVEIVAPPASQSLKWSIADLPEKLRTVAELLATGWSKTTAAVELGISADTMTRRCDAIADWLLANGAVA